MKNPSHEQLYDSVFVTRLFDEMSKTYGLVNTVTSFGFCIFWRRQCSRLVEFQVVDLMSGMAELSIHVNSRMPTTKITAIDLSPEMNKLAQNNVRRKRLANCHIVEGDALSTGLGRESTNAVVSTFGLKTFSEKQVRQLAEEVHRILKPGGQIAFLEISVPKFRLLRMAYMFYLKKVIPLAGRIFMGNPDNYRLLGVYTSEFQNCFDAIETFRDVGFLIQPRSFFFGCATGFWGQKEVTV